MRFALNAMARWTVLLLVLSLFELSDACFHDLYVTVGKMSGNYAGKWYVKQEGETLAWDTTVEGSVDHKVPLVDIFKPFEVIGYSNYGKGWPSTLEIYNYPKSHPDSKRVFLFSGPTRYDGIWPVTKVLNFYGNNGYVTVRDDATCDKLGYEEIYTKESCAEGAEYLDLQDTSPSTLRNTYYVGGCWLYYSSTLYFNTNSRGTSGYDCSDNFISCVCKANFPEGYDTTKFPNCVGHSLCEAAPTELDCAEGYFISSDNNTCSNQENRPFTCSPCPQGRFSNESNSSSCIMCDPGQYNNFIGQHKCRSCGPGKHGNLPRGATSCDLCLPGKYSTTSKGADEHSCKSCQPGSVQSFPGRQTCSKCSSGLYANPPINGTECLHCPPGFISAEGDAKCASCPPGKRSGRWGGTICISCDEGQYANKPVSATMCLTCPFGKFTTSSEAISCRECRNGTVYRVASGNSAGYCQPCGPGLYANKLANECLGCLSGYYSDLNENTKCEMCGTSLSDSVISSKLTNATSCSSCPVGKAPSSKYFLKTFGSCKKRIQSREVCQEAAKELVLFKSVASIHINRGPTGCSYVISDTPTLVYNRRPNTEKCNQLNPCICEFDPTGFQNTYSYEMITSGSCREGTEILSIEECYYAIIDQGYAVEYSKIESPNNKNIPPGCTMLYKYYSLKRFNINQAATSISCSPSYRCFCRKGVTGESEHAVRMFKLKDHGTCDSPIESVEECKDAAIAFGNEHRVELVSGIWSHKAPYGCNRYHDPWHGFRFMWNSQSSDQQYSHQFIGVCSTKCLDCRAGTYGNRCLNCPAGRYSEKYPGPIYPHMKDYCNECPTGRIGFEVAETDVSSACSCNYDSDCFSCPIGTYGFVKVKLTECPPAHQCFKSKSFLGIRLFYADELCRLCPPGKLGLRSKAVEKFMSTANYQEDKKLYIDTLCVSSCPTGKYARDILLSTRSHYDAIEEHERNDTSQLICEDCPAGKKGETASTGCTPCTAGKYQSMTGQTSCFECRKNTYSSQAEKECHSCSAGYVVFRGDNGLQIGCQPDPAITILIVLLIIACMGSAFAYASYRYRKHLQKKANVVFIEEMEKLTSNPDIIAKFRSSSLFENDAVHPSTFESTLPLGASFDNTDGIEMGAVGVALNVDETLHEEWEMAVKSIYEAKASGELVKTFNGMLRLLAREPALKSQREELLSIVSSKRAALSKDSKNTENVWNSDVAKAFGKLLKQM